MKELGAAIKLFSAAAAAGERHSKMKNREKKLLFRVRFTRYVT
jgi:tRNA(Phe) wybutosine-synthesizing methylase Tyw3